jgi:hypothetical protein
MQPETKDWTWVLERPCGECGVDVSRWSLAQVPATLHDSAMAWGGLLSAPDAAARPDEDVWSPLEYACHVRDVHRVMQRRVRLLLDEDDPVFDNWDQDATAVDERYGEQDPRAVDIDLVDAAGTVAGTYASVAVDAESRPGRRSNGSRFTVLTLARYHLHDVLHHLHDVGLPVPPGPGVTTSP